MPPHIEIAASLTLANPILLWLACLTQITARMACMLGCLAVATSFLRQHGVLDAAIDEPTAA